MIHFLLVPDGAAAMKLRRFVAEAGGRTGVRRSASPRTP
jgi:hypothetical protein